MSITHDPLRARLERWAWLVALGRAGDLGDPVHASMLLDTVNDFFNGARYESDDLGCDEVDRWSTPLEFITRDAGDCEEFAIAKYFTLIEMGMADTVLRITYVKALTLDQPHMVLAWHQTPAAEPLILDNLDPRILPASQRPDLIPVYSFNATDLWVARSRHEQVRSGDAATLSHWRQLQERLTRQLTGP